MESNGIAEGAGMVGLIALLGKDVFLHTVAGWIHHSAPKLFTKLTKKSGKQQPKDSHIDHGNHDA